MKREDIHVTADEDVLTIEGERKQEREIDEDRYYSREMSYGHFVRRIGLPPGVKRES